MQWRFEDTIDATPDAVYAWMCDFQPNDHSREAYLRGAKARPQASLRTVVSREGNHVKLHDAWGKEAIDLDVRLAPPEREVRVTGPWGYRATWRALPGPAGTRLVVEGELAPSGIMRLFAPLFAGRMRRQMEEDFRGHLEDARETLRKR